MRFGDIAQPQRRNGQEACQTASGCRNFNRRGDINAFNMINYESCENCRHFTPESICDYHNSIEYQFDMS